MSLKKYHYIISDIISSITDELINKYSINSQNINKVITENQILFHNLSWIATYSQVVESLINLKHTSENFKDNILNLIFDYATSYYLYKILYGINLNQVENTKLSDLDNYKYSSKIYKNKYIEKHLNSILLDSNITLISSYIIKNKERIFDCFKNSDNKMYLDELQKFVNSAILPNCNKWHINNELIPLDVLNKLSTMGIFSINIPNKYGGLNFNKQLLTLVSEELSRGYIGVGSLLTRNDIASEIIIKYASEDKCNEILPMLSKGLLIPSAVFTEPNCGSDLSKVNTTAIKTKVLGSTYYSINGTKTWITHGSRSDLLILLARTDIKSKGYSGLSLFSFKKKRGDKTNPFPDKNISGSEIPVIGYRGMKSYNIHFDNHLIPESSLIGTDEGLGFKQLMSTFESARLQTAARSNGLSVRAFELALLYSLSRVQFDKKIFEFPRIYKKLVHMLINIFACKAFTLDVANDFEKKVRNTKESSMVKLFCANYAWINSDISLQIHGSYGYAQEYEISRILCDSRIMSIFEGTSEIQAGIIAKELIKTRL